jgi:glycosyltransferase involved in cell wall biosynthesis
LAQTYRASEILVVDDGSTDDTADAARSFRGVRCLRQHNRGLAAARNRGLAATNGNYVLFLDADDRLLPNALEDGMKLLSKNPECAFAYGHVRLIAGDGSPLPTPQQSAVERDHYLELLRRNYIWTEGAVLYRRSVLASLGGFNESIGGSADFDLNARIARQFRICCTNTHTLEYRRHSESMSRDYAVMLRSAVLARRLQAEFAIGNPLLEEALRSGIRVAQFDYGEKLIACTRSWLGEGRWHEAIAGMVTLLRFYPQGFTRRVYNRLCYTLLSTHSRSVGGDK